MKKIFTLLTGIVFLITILIAGGCNSAKDNRPTNNLKRVKIYLKSIEINGGKHLDMRDSNGEHATDILKTDVMAGGSVIWKLDTESGIINIDSIYSRWGKGNIFIKNPEKRLFSKSFILRVPNDANDEEEYVIKYTLKDKTKVTIDPYIRIKP
jgi:hypothetical protein